MMKVASPSKTARPLLLPSMAMEVNTSLPTPTPSPMSRPQTPGIPICTPSNAASTQWRTVTCPRPPSKSYFKEDDASSSGLVTPANLWPSPNGTPLGTPTTAAIGFGFSAADIARVSQDISAASISSPILQTAQLSPGLGRPALMRAYSDSAAFSQVFRSAPLQTITDDSPGGKNAGWAGNASLDFSFEAAMAAEDMTTPSPGKPPIDLFQVTSPEEKAVPRLLRRANNVGGEGYHQIDKTIIPNKLVRAKTVGADGQDHGLNQMVGMSSEVPRDGQAFWLSRPQWGEEQ